MKKTRISKKNEEYNNTIENEIEEINELNDIELHKISKGILIENIYNLFIRVFTFLLKTLLITLKVSAIYLLWICLHYFSAHLYVKYCVPNTVFGFFMSPFMISTPHCQGLRWIVYNAAGIINNMWINIGAWIYSIIWIFKSDINVESPTM
jgi:hypothetical protein